MFNKGEGADVILRISNYVIDFFLRKAILDRLLAIAEQLYCKIYLLGNL